MGPWSAAGQKAFPLGQHPGLGANAFERDYFVCGDPPAAVPLVALTHDTVQACLLVRCNSDIALGGLLTVFRDVSLASKAGPHSLSSNPSSRSYATEGRGVWVGQTPAFARFPIRGQPRPAC